MTTVVRLSVPARALGGVTETLLRTGIAAAVLEHLGEPTSLHLEAAGDEPMTIHVVPGPTAQGSRTRADQVVAAIGSWLDGVLGPEDPSRPRRARVELEVPVHPQLPQGNPLFGGVRRVTSVTGWG